MWTDGNGRRHPVCKKTVRGAVLFSHAARKARNPRALPQPGPAVRRERTERPRVRRERPEGQQVPEGQRIERVPAMPPPEILRKIEDLGKMAAVATLVSLAEPHVLGLARTWRAIKDAPRRIFPRKSPGR